MRVILICVALLWSQSILGQVKPDVFPEDIGREGLHARCFCKPGVRNKSRTRGVDISFNYLTQGTYKEQTSQFTAPLTTFKQWLNYRIGLKAPIFNKEAFRLFVGYKYFAERYQFDFIGADFEEVFQPLRNTILKNSSISLIASKPLDEKKYLIFRLGYAANGDYNGFLSFDNDYSIFKFTGIYGNKPNDDLEWGIGLNISKSFRRLNVLPFVVYNRTLNDKWGIESALPAYAFIRRNFSDRNLLLMGVEYNSKSYRLDLIHDGFTRAYDYNHSEFIISGEMEHQIMPWFWGSVKLGYQMNFSSNFERKNSTAISFDVDPTNNLYIQVGLFLSPPANYASKK